MNPVWIIDDDRSIRWVFEKTLSKEDIAFKTFSSAEEALRAMNGSPPQVVVSDIRMPGGSGLELLQKIKERHPHLPVIIMTAYSDLESAVAAFQGGAFEYLPKPFDVDHAVDLIRRAMEESLRQTDEVEVTEASPEILGQASSMQEVFRAIGRLSQSNATVLITGESGTGKELVAQTIHQLSPRASFPFVAINCAAIPETLLESEIFGHEKGAFTGAADRRQGCFELADRGTLFLDEIGEMTPTTQVKLLRVLQERKFRRLGGRNEQSVDVRVIAATNIDPVEAVAKGKLREDLFYRLNVFAITLPPLRERRQDLPLLVQAFLNEFNQRNQKSIAGVDQQVMRILEQYNWPGNVRELRNVVERATILAPGPFIEARHLPPMMSDEPPVHQQPQVALAPGTTVEEAERRLIMMTLAHTRDNKTRAAEILGISLKTLHNKLNKLRLRPRRDDSSQG